MQCWVCWSRPFLKSWLWFAVAAIELKDHGKRRGVRIRYAASMLRFSNLCPWSKFTAWSVCHVLLRLGFVSFMRPSTMFFS
mmetsp:Transcript_8904/g.19435  ORF Transcript_8904/g.19435 Transcript_8904/m.19435 type:complete len:81 (-) Transcript_8904:121-363(-)